MAEFLLETNYINPVFRQILVPNLSALDSDMLTDFGPKFVETANLYLDDLSFSDG